MTITWKHRIFIVHTVADLAAFFEQVALIEQGEQLRPVPKAC
jgi:hypothetical protein